MIIDKKIIIKTTNKNITYYKKFYDNIKSGDTIEIYVDQLPDTSKEKVNVVCDICGKENRISMFSYRRNIENYDYYSCRKCGNKKAKLTSMDKYGVDSFTKTDDYIKKTKKTKLEKYGDENYTNQEQTIKTCQKKYNVDNYMLSDDFKEKSKNTMNLKYGVDKPLQNKEFLDKLILTNNKKYNCDFVFQNKEIREKSNETKFKKYGDKNFNNRKKYKETCQERFGFENPMKNEIIKNKTINTMYNKKT